MTNYLGNNIIALKNLNGSTPDALTFSVVLQKYKQQVPCAHQKGGGGDHKEA